MTLLDRARLLADRELLSIVQRLPENPCLGHRAQHTPKLALADYLTAEAQPPAHVHRGLFHGYSDILGNDRLGDCGEAMTIHGIEGMHHAAGTRVPPFTTQDAINLYEPVGGYVPGDPSTDNGTDNNVLINYWTNTGVRCTADGSVHKIAGSVYIDATNDVECRIGIYEFACLFLAVGLPVTAQGQRVWDVVGDGQTGDSAPGSWGWHDVVAMAYDPSAIDVNTWGVWTPVTNRFVHAYQGGAFVVAARDMLGRRGTSVTGLDWTRLAADLQKL